MRFHFFLFLVLFSGFVSGATVFSDGVLGEPVARIVCPTEPLVMGVEYTFDASFSECSGSCREFWTFGQNQAVLTEPIFTYNTVGNFNVNLTVEDGSSVRDSDICVVTVESPDADEIDVPEIPLGFVVLSVVALSLLLFRDEL